MAAVGRVGIATPRPAISGPEVGNLKVAVARVAAGHPRGAAISGPEVGSLKVAVARVEAGHHRVAVARVEAGHHRVVAARVEAGHHRVAVISVQGVDDEANRPDVILGQNRDSLRLRP